VRIKLKKHLLDMPMSVKTVDAGTLHQWLQQGSALLVDVREPAEYRARHVAQAQNIPLARIEAAGLPEGHRIVIHCLKGGRGASACKKLIQQNPRLEIYNLEGGIEAWEAAGLPVSSGGYVLSLDRQVQLTIGIILFVASSMTFFVNPLFVIITGALGLGLTMAGATGFCGLARIMAHAPWNR
jgi:rhodanese-related sulfurtransferase